MGGRPFPCQYCGCDVTRDVTLGGSDRWVDTRGSALCPAWQSNFHAPHIFALPIPEAK